MYRGGGTWLEESGIMHDLRGRGCWPRSGKRRWAGRSEMAKNSGQGWARLG